MTKEQSEFTIDEILDVRVVRVQDLTRQEKIDIHGICTLDYIACENFYIWFDIYAHDIEEAHYQEYGERTILPRYRDNPYVFLYSCTPVRLKDE